MPDSSTPRRSFMARAAAAVVSGLALEGWTGSADRLAAQGTANPDQWLDRLTGKHRCLFDFPEHHDGMPQIHILNYINTYQKAYGVPASDVNAVGTCYGAPWLPSSMPIAWNDAMWAKYKVGEILKLNDGATGAPATRNMFWRPQKGDPILVGGAVVAAGAEALSKQGVMFLMCNNAFMAWVNFLAGKGHGTAPEIERDIRANLNPGIITVPAMVIAIEKAQGKGIAYNRQG
jgi:hypothetical protein